MNLKKIVIVSSSIFLLGLFLPVNKIKSTVNATNCSTYECGFGECLGTERYVNWDSGSVTCPAGITSDGCYDSPSCLTGSCQDGGHEDCIGGRVGDPCGNDGTCQDSNNDHECGCFGEEEDLTPTPTITPTPTPTLTGSPDGGTGGGEVETRQNQVLYVNSTPLGSTSNVSWGQTIQNLSAGTYMLSASVLTFAPGSRGVKVGLYSGETLHGDELNFSTVSSDYVTKTVNLNISTGGAYTVRLSANDGAEADFDFVSLKKQGDAVELLLNNQFDQVVIGITKDQPDGWGAGGENWGYVWGEVDPYNLQDVFFMNSSSRDRYGSDGNFSWLRYEKGLNLSPGSYQITALARAPRLSSLAGGRGAQIAVACGELNDCPGPEDGQIPVNQFVGSVNVTSIDYTQVQSSVFTIYGDPSSSYSYVFRIFANDGAEVLVDNLKLEQIVAGQSDPIVIVEEEFNDASAQTTTVGLPYNWIKYDYADLYSAVSPRFDVYASDPYIIPIGSKDSVTVTIGTGGTGNAPQIKFTSKLAGAETHPDMYFKLRAIDDLAFMSDPNSAPACESPGVGGVDLYVPVQADSFGVYTPVPSINVPSPAGGTVATVADGWVILTGMSAGKYYTLNLKAPKTRGTEMLEHALLSGGQNANQNYDWTANALQPGDLPDPNNSNKQDCTVNSIDISLINSRLGNTDADSLEIADVSYDGVVNANDIAQVVGTLSTKPDDDN